MFTDRNSETGNRTVMTEVSTSERLPYIVLALWMFGTATKSDKEKGCKIITVLSCHKYELY